MQWVVGRGGRTCSVNIPRLSPYNSGGCDLLKMCIKSGVMAPKTTSPNQQIAMNYVCSETNSGTLHLTCD